MKRSIDHHVLRYYIWRSSCRRSKKKGSVWFLCNIATEQTQNQTTTKSCIPSDGTYQWYNVSLYVLELPCIRLFLLNVSFLWDGNPAHENRSRCGRIGSGLPRSNAGDNLSFVIKWWCLRHPNVFRFMISTTIHDPLYILPRPRASLKNRKSHAWQKNYHQNTTKRIFQVRPCQMGHVAS